VSKRGLWNFIAGSAVPEQDERDFARGVGRVQSQWKLVMSHMESNPDNVWAARRRALQDVWTGWLCALLNVDKDGTVGYVLPLSGGRFLITEETCPAQTGHNDFPVEDGIPPGYFIITTSGKPRPLLVCPSTHKFVHYSDEALAVLAKTLKMDVHLLPSVPTTDGP